MKAKRERSKPKSSKKHKTPRTASRFTASTADRYDLYQRSVQEPEFEVDFLRKVFRELRGHDPLHFREDFCGTAYTAATWVTQGAQFTAEGVDLDPEPLAWGREHNVVPLGTAAGRVSLVQGDVRAHPERLADVRCAHNFSYNVFHKRNDLLDYFRAVRDGLTDDGIFVLDMHGGSEAIEPLEEERWVDDDFIYVWDQDEHWPGTGEHRCYIHFRFPDGSELRRAFTYDWRLWDLPEVKDVLADAGFSRVVTYFEQFDDDGDGTGQYEVDERGFPCESWLAYLVAVK
jgi:SAM-dependent methyltransferase